MGRYLGPSCALCRREGFKLFLKGERCYTDKCAFERRNYPAGQHGQKRSKLSEFGVQLREKQKVKRVYGMFERQFRKFFREAAQHRGLTADLFFRNLELRLDNVVYRMGFGTSRNDARQVVRHNHVCVNGKRLNIPSARLKVGDTVTIVPKSANLNRFVVASELYKRRQALPWLDVDHNTKSGKIIALPQRDDIQLNVKERLIIELYSK